jgi:hypothetical protein
MHEAMISPLLWPTPNRNRHRRNTIELAAIARDNKIAA